MILLKNKNIKFFVLSFFCIIFVSGCVFNPPSAQEKNANQKVSVSTTFYPLGYFAKKVGGEFVDVKTITPLGGEPHDYEPTPSDMIAVENSKLFIFNGAGFDPWAKNIQKNLGTKNIKVLEMSSVVENLLEAHEDEDEHGHDEQEAASHSEDEGFDPHFWLDPSLAQKEVDAIALSLGEIDQAHAAFYTQNANAFKKELQKIDDEYQASLKSCMHSQIVVSHNAFSYLARKYQFEIFALAGISPEQEPSALRLKELADFVKHEKIQVIFFETLVSPKLAQTLADESGIKTAVLNPIEGLSLEEELRGENYETLMRENLRQLQSALVCQ